MNFPNITPYLSQALCLEWWQTELKERPQDHSGPAAIVVVTAMLITTVWGRFEALGFLFISAVTYPFSHTQIRQFMNLEGYPIAQAVTCIAIQFIALDSWRKLLSVALACSMLTQEWSRCQIAQRRKEEIDRLSKLNDDLEGRISSLRAACEQLGQDVGKLLIQTDKKEDLGQQEKEVTQKRETLSTQAELDTSQLIQKIENLSLLCQTAASNKKFTEVIQTISLKQAEVASLTAQCTQKNEQLQLMIDQVQSFASEMRPILKGAQTSEQQSQQYLQQILAWVQAIMERKI